MHLLLVKMGNNCHLGFRRLYFLQMQDRLYSRPKQHVQDQNNMKHEVVNKYEKAVMRPTLGDNAKAQGTAIQYETLS